MWVYFFRNGIFLDLITKTHCLLYCVSYVIQFINLQNDKSDATSQLGYIPFSLFSQFAKVAYITKHI